MALPLSTSEFYSTPTHEKHFSSSSSSPKVSGTMVGSEGEADTGGGGGGGGERLVSNSPLRDLEMLAEMEERGGLDLRSVSNSPLRDLEMLAEMEERGYGDNRSASNSPLRDLEMLAQMVESSDGNASSSSSSSGNVNGIIATSSNLVSSPDGQDGLVHAAANNGTSGSNSSTGVTAGSGNGTKAMNNPHESSYSPCDPAAFANTTSNSDNANNQANNQANNGPSTTQDRLLASRNTFHRIYHMMLDMGPAQPGEKSESSSPVTDRGKPRMGDNGTEGSASMSISPLSDTLNTVAAAALIHEAGIRLEQMASDQASQHRSHATYAPGSPSSDDEPHSQDSRHEDGFEDQFADEDLNDDADEDDAAADENSGEAADEDNNEDANEDPEDEEYEDAYEDADGDDEYTGSDEKSDSEETPESLSARHRLLDDFENYFVAPQDMEALRHTLFSESDSDLTSLGRTPSPDNSELRELDRQRKLRQKPLCVCKGWCSCQKYKVFYGSWVDAPNEGVNSNNLKTLEANGFELPSQTHLPEHVITGEVFPEASMRSTLHRGQDGVPVTPPAEQPYNHVFSWDERPRPRRPPGWQGVWIPEGEQSIEEILGHGESAIWVPQTQVHSHRSMARDDSDSSLTSLDAGDEDEQLDDDLDVPSEPGDARQNGVEDVSPSEEMEMDENGDVDMDLYSRGEVLDNAIEKIATNSASVESDEVY